MQSNFLGWLKILGPAQKILGPVKGQGKIHNFLMPCPFTGPKMFCAGPNILSQPKKFDCI